MPVPYRPWPLLSLSAYFERHRQRYYDLMLDVSRAGAWRDWIAFALIGVRDQARDASERVDRLLRLREDYRKRLEVGKSSFRPLKVVDHLFAQPIVTARAVAELLDVTAATAIAIIDKLTATKVLVPQDERTYGKQYAAKGVVELSKERRPHADVASRRDGRLTSAAEAPVLDSPALDTPARMGAYALPPRRTRRPHRCSGDRPATCRRCRRHAATQARAVR